MNKDFERENETLKEENYIEYDIEDLDEDEEFKEIILTLEDDTELTCLVVAQYQVEDQDYIALLPIDEDEEPGDILLYKATYSDDETFDVSMIEDEQEFEIAADAYYKYLDENEIDLEDLHYHHHDHDHDHHHHHHDFDDYEEDYYDDMDYEDGFEVDYLDDDDFEDDQN
ncbi:DUF1292 domain-containing protein [Helcococcus kunzii]|uniref:DUF1292 domain-containing protein n=1 Tax=Helcococcus kunzii ATCC 51366 TaxID=883114 RepID=H3NNJ0_9FIRM|nr:DUF1292 domain-containing protein [Helcococcus kunzii]EHR33965.1 hypothetical protein HMPREF9709_00901 [Helcococcus kunzii ATCC 51366]MCT1795573.1 DUF1292 domain-containing protein [Helcococcus kunzii]MCT1989319.1 DUF1292 domain-containing protein [Helcococcus kunzii]QUY64816.1 DUF1292 domain-containing protein [Helcococcus kunzii]QZO77257.1 DUF1292 domain-containing protein [Helcococcus kunzii]